MTLHSALDANPILRALFLHRYHMELSEDWPQTRIQATLLAERRLAQYDLERMERMARYRQHWGPFPASITRLSRAIQFPVRVK